MVVAATDTVAVAVASENTRSRSRTDVNVMSCTVCETIVSFRVWPSETLSAAGVIAKDTRVPSSSRTSADAEAPSGATS